MAVTREDIASPGTVLPRDLVGHLRAVGQVDLLVGVPTLNHAQTIGGTVQVVREAFRRHFPRQRTVLIDADGGSADGTLEAAASALRSGGAAPGGLRTSHQILTTYLGSPGRGSAFRLLLTAADLLQADALAIVDPDVTSLTPEWVAALLAPVLAREMDFVAPVFHRHPLDAPLITQLVRPLFRAAYGYAVEEPASGELACSGRFAVHCREQAVWRLPLARNGIEGWITASALLDGFRTCQVVLGPRTLAPGHRPNLGETFGHLVGGLFECLHLHAHVWTARSGVEPLAEEGQRPTLVPASHFDAAGLTQHFGQNVRDLGPVLEQVLAVDTLACLQAAAADTDGGSPIVPDELWAAVVCDMALAYHAGVMDRTHIVQALMPLYLGRVGAFWQRHAHEAPGRVDQAVRQLERQFEAVRPAFVRRWKEISER